MSDKKINNFEFEICKKKFVDFKLNQFFEMEFDFENFPIQKQTIISNQQTGKLKFTFFYSKVSENYPNNQTCQQKAADFQTSLSKNKQTI